MQRNLTFYPEGNSDIGLIEQLPKVLLPHQESALKTRIANTEELITDESSALEIEKATLASTSKTNRARIDELSGRLAELRKTVRPAREKDDFGRVPREERDEADMEDHDGRPADRPEEDDRERGVQIRGEDGDVEVEY